MSQPQSTIKKYFRKLRDPRIRGRKRHLLLDIVVPDAHLCHHRWL